MLIAVAWTVLRGITEAAPLALVAGFILDLLSEQPFGLATLAVLAACGLTGLAQRGLSRVTVFLPLTSALLATLAYYVVSTLALRASGKPLDAGAVLLDVLGPALISNLLAMYPIYALMRRLHLRTAYGQAE